MVFRWSLISLTVLLFVLTVQSQSSGLSALADYYPKCSLRCMTDYIPKSSCVSEAGLNQTCLCTNPVLNQQITLCAEQSCTVEELLTTKNVTSTLCHEPVRGGNNNIGIIGIAYGGFTILIFLVRILARLLTREKKLHGDDIVMAVTMVFTVIPLTVLVWFIGQYGLGKDIWTIPFPHITLVLQLFWVTEMLYCIATALIKVSILLFLHRIFPSKRLKLWIYAVIGLCLAYGITFFFVSMLQCHPIHYVWDQWKGEGNGSCNSLASQVYAGAGVNIGLDIAVILLPLKELSALQIPVRKRFSVMIMFLVGIFATVVSGVRLKYLVQIQKTQNPTYDFFDPGIWSLVEIYTGVICACMPAVYGLIKTWRPETTSEKRSGKSYGSTTKVSSGRHTPKAETFKTSHSDASDWIRLTEVEQHSQYEASVQGSRPYEPHAPCGRSMV